MISALEQTMSHQWGSYPAARIGEYVDDIACTVGPYLAVGISDGEIDLPTCERRNWVVGRMKLIEGLSDIEVLKQGGYVDYADMSVLDVRDALNSRELELGYHDMAKQSLPDLQHALASCGLSHLPMQVGIPGDMQIPRLAFGSEKVMSNFDRYALPFIQAGDAELQKLTSDEELQKQGLAIQFENPLETLAALTMAKAGKSIDPMLAGAIVRQVAVLPHDSLTALHFCYGRYKGVPLDAPNPEETGAYAPVIELVNQTLSKWPKGHNMPRIVGIPIIPEGGHMPSGKAIREVIAQLEDLDLPTETILAPGTATLAMQIEDLIKLNGDIQHRIGRPVAVSSPCGKSSLPVGTARLVLGREAIAIKKLREAV